MTILRKDIKHLRPCTAATDWLGLRRNPQKAWDECPRGDWMIWLLTRTKADPAKLRLVACDIARTVLHLVPEGEDRPRIAIETAERYARGEATDGELRTATDAAWAAADAAWDAAWTAARAASARDAASDTARDAATAAARAAAHAAARAAASAAASAAHAAARAARAATHAASADIVRKHFPTPPTTGAL